MSINMNRTNIVSFYFLNINMMCFGVHSVHCAHQISFMRSIKWYNVREFIELCHNSNEQKFRKFIRFTSRDLKRAK